MRIIAIIPLMLQKSIRYSDVGSGTVRAFNIIWQLIFPKQKSIKSLADRDTLPLYFCSPKYVGCLYRQQNLQTQHFATRKFPA